MGYNNGAIELGRMNLEKGKIDIAFDIFFDLAKNDLDEDIKGNIHLTFFKVHAT